MTHDPGSALLEALAENHALRKEVERMRAEHFRIHEHLSAQVAPLREALEAVVSHCLPGATPSQMSGYDRPWQLAAAALYGVAKSA